ncbi:HK97-gp10 family putative phage morphogenesis protein [Arthrobacter luteolus]|uniref:HK97-gp10 family putative phage morphogenesis protein n=1 Tax=Arthrobacter luteolus TaxID=98672 RepID=UPI000835068D|nr:HK97-gp10 family putative phage morphogenesis protein [Arthrobacter luteolus]
MGFENSQVRRFAADIARAQVTTGLLTQTVVRKTARDVVKDAKLLAPVDTGNLRASIGHSDLRSVGRAGDLSVEIGPTANYGVFLELGTSRAPAQPFMGPAADRNEGPFAQALAQIAEEGLNG